jgi:hypothetical protein
MKALAESYPSQSHKNEYFNPLMHGGLMVEAGSIAGYRQAEPF